MAWCSVRGSTDRR